MARLDQVSSPVVGKVVIHPPPPPPESLRRAENPKWQELDQRLRSLSPLLPKVLWEKPDSFGIFSGSLGRTGVSVQSVAEMPEAPGRRTAGPSTGLFWLQWTECLSLSRFKQRRSFFLACVMKWSKNGTEVESANCPALYRFCLVLSERQPRRNGDAPLPVLPGSQVWPRDHGLAVAFRRKRLGNLRGPFSFGRCIPSLPFAPFLGRGPDQTHQRETTLLSSRGLLHEREGNSYPT